ncbi:MAG: oxidoreductase, partial [Lentisphaeria bacterium]
NRGSSRRNIVHLKHRREVDIVLCSIYDASYDPAITVIGTQGSITLRSKDSYGSFRAQLVAFVNYLRTGIRPFDISQTFELMQLLIGGIESRDNQGIEIPVEPEFL